LFLLGIIQYVSCFFGYFGRFFLVYGGDTKKSAAFPGIKSMKNVNLFFLFWGFWHKKNCHDDMAVAGLYG
jgi:hypothetical protein